VGGPGDGVGLAGAGAVLDQVFVPRPFGAGGGHQAVDGIPLVEAGEDQGLLGETLTLPVFLVLPLQVDEAADDVEPGIAGKNLLPQIIGGIT